MIFSFALVKNTLDYMLMYSSIDCESFYFYFGKGSLEKFIFLDNKSLEVLIAVYELVLEGRL